MKEVDNNYSSDISVNYELEAPNKFNKPNKNKSNFSCFFILFLFISLSLLLMGFSGYLYYEIYNLKTVVNKSDLEQLDNIIDGRINSKISKIEYKLNTTEDKLNNNTSIISNINNTVKNNQEDLNKLQDNLDNIANISNPQKKSDYQLQLLTIKSVINFIDINLRLNKNSDLSSVIDVLKLVDINLKNNTNKNIVNIRKDILALIEYFSNINKPDIVSISALLQEYINTVDNLALKDLLSINNTNLNNLNIRKPGNNSNSNSNSDNNFSTKEKLLHSLDDGLGNIKSVLFDLIKIKKLNSNDFINLLDEEQLNAIKAMFKLKATLASINLENYNNNLYHANITDLIHNTKLYMASNNILQDKLLSLLEKANQENLNLNIDFSRLEELNNKIEGLL